MLSGSDKGLMTVYVRNAQRGRALYPGFFLPLGTKARL